MMINIIIIYYVRGRDEYCVELSKWKWKKALQWVCGGTGISTGRELGGGAKSQRTAGAETMVGWG